MKEETFDIEVEVGDLLERCSYSKNGKYVRYLDACLSYEDCNAIQRELAKRGDRGNWPEWPIIRVSDKCEPCVSVKDISRDVLYEHDLEEMLQDVRARQYQQKPLTAEEKIEKAVELLKSTWLDGHETIIRHREKKNEAIKILED